MLHIEYNTTYLLKMDSVSNQTDFIASNQQNEDEPKIEEEIAGVSKEFDQKVKIEEEEKEESKEVKGRLFAK